MVQLQKQYMTDGLLPCSICIVICMDIFQSVVNILSSVLPPQQKNVMKTTWGVLDPPVGNTRLNVVRLVASLLQSNTHSINTELINLNTLGVILVSTVCIFDIFGPLSQGANFVLVFSLLYYKRTTVKSNITLCNLSLQLSARLGRYTVSLNTYDTQLLTFSLSNHLK